jgi:hypothetical protein
MIYKNEFIMMYNNEFIACTSLRIYMSELFQTYKNLYV